MKILPGEIKVVKCSVRTIPLTCNQEMLFVPVQSPDWPEGLTGTENVVKLQKGTRSKIFIPVSNDTCHDITLRPRTVLGHVQSVKAVYPAAAKPVDFEEVMSHREETLGVEKAETAKEVVSEYMVQPDADQWDPPVPVSHLLPQQQEEVRKLLREECAAFSRNDEDVGCIPSLELKIRLKDTTPVRRTYMSVPKPLHKEVKEYLEDLLNRGWITKSRSAYSSPMVCVRKKDGSLRLCCDYRELNQKSIPDRHPIPRIQDMLDSLSGSAWFSILDQGKAYHQGFLEENSRPLTAFITPWGSMNGSAFHLACRLHQQSSNAAWRNV